MKLPTLFALLLAACAAPPDAMRTVYCTDGRPVKLLMVDQSTIDTATKSTLLHYNPVAIALPPDMIWLSKESSVVYERGIINHECEHLPSARYPNGRTHGPDGIFRSEE